jgi:Tol biopolymer transport system component
MPIVRQAVGVKSILMLMFLGFFNQSSAASFGQNNVQYTYFKWKYLTTEHFNIYYNQGGEEVADFAAKVAEQAFTDVSETFIYFSESDEPITVITYQSHNDFEQTNVTGQPDESTGGVTEFLKTRVIVPFQGNHEEFRHVLYHELTHAMMLNMMYGKGLNAIIAGISQARVPLWFIEGLAEYVSQNGLDPETEMILRDAVVNDVLPEIDQLDNYGYLGVYKCGQSVHYWIAQRYGNEKIGEMLHQIMKLNDFDRALKASLGIDRKELSKRWRRFIKSRYWSQVSYMDPPDNVSRQLTDHEKEFCFINNSPAISPNGEWLTFLSNRSDYFDIYLMNTIDGKVKKKIVKGQISGKFEELHWLRPGITWSPKGDKIALCAKAGELDALYIIDVESGKIVKEFEFKSDGLFSPAWSPDGNSIAFIIVNNGQSDIAIVDINTGHITNLTNDRFDDADPSWSPDSRKLLFTSDRNGTDVNNGAILGRDFADYNYADFDIYEVNIQSHKLTRLTNDSFYEKTPLWSNVDNTIIYVSDESRINNIYAMNIETSETKALTNLVTGAFQLSVARETGAVAYTSYFNNGYDIFLIEDPLSNQTKKDVYQAPTAGKISNKDGSNTKLGTGSFDYQHYVFDRLYSGVVEEEPEDSSEVVSRERQQDGSYPVKEYEMHLEPDMVLVYASYSPYYAMQGSGIILFTDILGNHQLYVSANVNSAIKYSNVFCMYNYMARRIDFGGGSYHNAYPFYGNNYNVIWLDRTYGAFVTGSYPLNRFNRIETGLEYFTVERSIDWKSSSAPPSVAKDEFSVSSLMPQIGYVHDTSVWRWPTSPANGGRWRADLLWSPSISSNKDESISFTTLSLDWRRYFAYHKDYTFSVRLSSAVSEGNNPQQFFLGGMMNWFNARYDNPSNDVSLQVQDIYYSRFVTPLRGVGYYNQIGSRYVLGNFEFRYPFIKHLVMGWPLPFYFRNVRGAAFYDFGTAWSPKEINSNLLPDPSDWASGFGFGIRMDLGVFPIEWNIAWSPETDFVPQYYFSLNYGF